MIDTDLWDLLAEYRRLHAVWRSSSGEQDRRAMAAAWSIASTHPGEHSNRPDPRHGRLCEPTPEVPLAPRRG
jgi:hypothetical protein